MASPTTRERWNYGWRVLCQASGVLSARLRPALAARSAEARPANVMFSAALPPALATERAALERFDLYLYDVARHCLDNKR